MDGIRSTDVVFITVDSLRPDHLGIYGHRPSPSPFIDDLLKRGIQLTNCYSVGAPTQFAAPGLLSSTLPLDYGGYEFGLRGRPVTLAEHFKSYGYATGGFITGFWLSGLYRYDRGFDTFEELFDIESALKNFGKVYVRFSREYLQDGDTSFSTIVEVLRPFVSEFLDWFIDFCDRTDGSPVDATDSYQYSASCLEKWNVDAIKDTVTATKRSFDASEEGYVRSLLYGETMEKLFADIRSSKMSSVDPLPRGISPVLNPLLVIEGLYPFFRSWLKASGMRSTVDSIGNWLTASYVGEVPSADYVFSRAEQWITSTDEPTFSWVHLNDIHAVNLFSWERGRDRVKQEFKMHLQHLTKIAKSGRGYSGSPRYDLSVRYIDSALRDFITGLHRDLQNPPIIVLTSDHGVPVLPPRSGDWVAQFFDELLHVPAVIVHPSLQSGRFDGLCSTIDIGPALVEALEMEMPDGFQGRPLSSLRERSRSHVIAEDLARGPCTPELKPANVCIRTKSRKLTCSRHLNENDTLSIRSAFDIESDPDEKDDLSSQPLPDEFECLEQLARDRLDSLADSLD